MRSGDEHNGSVPDRGEGPGGDGVSPEGGRSPLHRGSPRSDRPRPGSRLGYRQREPRLGQGAPRHDPDYAKRAPRPRDTVPDMEPVTVRDTEQSGTEYHKRPLVDPYLERGPRWWVAGLLALAFSGLGQLYNGRWLRGIASVALPGATLLVAAVTGSPVFYLIAFGSGVLTAPLALTLFAGLVGWVPLGHPALWMGLPLKAALVLEAALDARRIRRFRKEPTVRRWARIAYGASLGGLLLVWIFTTGLATVRGPDMNPVLEPGDHVVIDRLAFGLQLPLVGVRIGGQGIPRGARVAVLDPEGSGELLVRRVFAVEGDHVAFGPQAGPAGIRMPLLGHGGRAPVPVVWLPWPGPCVYELEPRHRTARARYARCHAVIELAGATPYRVSYPATRPGAKATTWREGVVPRGHVYLLGDNRGGRDSRHFGPVPERAIRGQPRVVLWSRDSHEGIRWHRMGLRITDRP